MAIVNLTRATTHKVLPSKMAHFVRAVSTFVVARSYDVWWQKMASNKW